MRDVDHLLTSLADEPVPPLPGAAAARSRGDRRTRRTRALASGGAFVAVVAIAATVAFATSRPDERGVQPTNPTPVASSDAPTPKPTSEPPGGPDAALQAALLDDRDLEALWGGDWSVRMTDDLPFQPLPQCGTTPEGTARNLVFLNGPDGRVVGHEVVRYADEVAAERAFQRTIGCPGYSPVYEAPGGGVRVTFESRGVRIAVQRVGTFVTGAGLRGDDAKDLDELGDRAAAEVRCAPDRCRWTASTALLDVADADRVEDGAWEKVAPGKARRLLDPCAGGTAYPTDVRIDDTATGALQARRETGGTTVAQETYRYMTEADAVAALDGYERAVRACTRKPADDGMTTVYAVSARDADALYVRVHSECGTCVPWPYYVVVVRVGDGLAVLSAETGEDGDPGLEWARKWGTAATDEIRAAQAG